jgi:hypothetical protein
MSDEEKQEIEAVDLSGRRKDDCELVRLSQSPDHWHLHAICIRLPSDYEPYGYRVHTSGSDCSCGCKWFLKLQALPMDWGVCANPQSPRCGLLTFEHQGCAFFTSDESKGDEESVEIQGK